MINPLDLHDEPPSLSDSLVNLGSEKNTSAAAPLTSLAAPRRPPDLGVMREAEPDKSAARLATSRGRARLANRRPNCQRRGLADRGEYREVARAVTLKPSRQGDAYGETQTGTIDVEQAPTLGRSAGRNSLKRVRTGAGA